MREVVHALGILTIVGLLRLEPAWRQQVAQRSGQRLELLTLARPLGIDHVVEHQVPLVRRILVACEMHWAGLLPENLTYRHARVLCQKPVLIEASCPEYGDFSCAAGDQEANVNELRVTVPPLQAFQEGDLFARFPARRASTIA